jgi:hypothetical protein
LLLDLTELAKSPGSDLKQKSDQIYPCDRKAHNRLGHYYSGGKCMENPVLNKILLDNPEG